MIHNLPSQFIGLSPPFPVLPQGAAFELRSSDGVVVRRGIVMRDPTTTPDFVWYHSKTRFVTGEEPVCHGFNADLDASCFHQMKMYAVENFDSFIDTLPYALKKLMGHTKRTATKRDATIGPRPPVEGQIVQSVTPVDATNHNAVVDPVGSASEVVDDVSPPCNAQVHLHDESQTVPSVMPPPVHHGNQTGVSPVIETIHHPVGDAVPLSNTMVIDQRPTTAGNPAIRRSRAVAIPQVDPPTTVPTFAEKPQRKPRSDRGVRRGPNPHD